MTLCATFLTNRSYIDRTVTLVMAKPLTVETPKRGWHLHVYKHNTEEDFSDFGTITVLNVRSTVFDATVS